MAKNKNLKVHLIDEEQINPEAIKRVIRDHSGDGLTTNDIKSHHIVASKPDLIIFYPSDKLCDEYPCVRHLRRGVVISNLVTPEYKSKRRF